MSHTKMEERKLIYKGKTANQPKRFWKYYCYKCDGYAKINERHDAYFCESCDEWLESACNSDCDCHDYFGGRPEKPSGVSSRPRNDKKS